MPFDAEAKPVNQTKLVLQKARDLIEKGWCQNATQIGESYCMMGAIASVTDVWSPSINVLGKAIDTPSIVGWNDTSGRTQAEVLAAFDKAIASLD
jgi:hypothetical protein